MIASDIQTKINGALEEIFEKMIIRSELKYHFPAVHELLKEFVLRKGKRIRPLLFAFSYIGYNRGIPDRLYHSAAALELLHLFALIHDDVIDRSNYRRGGLTLHRLFENAFGQNTKIRGEDLAIVVADIFYSAAIEAFLEVRENSKRKEAALRRILDAAIRTGNGQLTELLFTSKGLHELTLHDIYATYDNKTAAYTFSGPLTAGALLAGASPETIERLEHAGLLFGRAFQICDDINEFFETTTTKTIPDDIKESRRTILMWHAYHHGNKNTHDLIHQIESKCYTPDSGSAYLDMLQQSGSFAFAHNTVKDLITKGTVQFKNIDLDKDVKQHLFHFLSTLFTIKSCGKNVDTNLHCNLS